MFYKKKEKVPTSIGGTVKRLKIENMFDGEYISIRDIENYNRSIVVIDTSDPKLNIEILKAIIPILHLGYGGDENDL